MRYVEESISNEPSILIPRKGSLENLYYVDTPFWTVDTLFWSKINKEIVDGKYLFYLLKTIDLKSLNEGTAIPSLTTKTLNNLSVSIPIMEIQKKISKILNDLDEKIRINNKINNNLWLYILLFTALFFLYLTFQISI